MNEERDAAGDWDPAGTTRLWRYNLHYFDDLTAAGAASREEWHRALLARWVEDNPPLRGTGWEPYPTSLRIVNWIKWTLGGGALPSPCVASLAVQARWLAGRLETHLLGNHLFSNAKALLFAGTWFDGPEADRWFATGRDILRGELDEQFLPDGGHFELSPMYHALGVEDLLDLTNLAAAFPARWAGVLDRRWLPRLVAARQWLQVMQHPDGDVAHFNDSAAGIAPTGAALEQYAQRLGLPPLPRLPACVHLRDSGYVRLAHADAVLLVDVASVGPDYLPAHAHADTLSFELSVRGRRMLVNSGTSTYAVGRQRDIERGTAAHNTVVVDGRDSSEVWAGFRVGRRARVSGVSVDSASRTVEASHDGFSRAFSRRLHRRRWTLGANALAVEDGVTGSFTRAEAYYHLHPSVTDPPTLSPDGRVATCTAPGGMISLTATGAGWRIEPGAWHPRFGATMPAFCLVATFDGASATVRIEWTG